jgi:hypothetical protein
MYVAGSERNKVFISYSREDDTWLQKLQVHLKPLERNGIVDRWDDSRISAGALWREEITKALASARVAVLLVSKHFLASDFIAKEELPALLTAAESEGARILPVLVGPCRLPPNLSRFQALNRPERTLSEMTEAEQDRVWIELLSAIEMSLEKLASPPPRLVFASCCSEDQVAAEAVIDALAERGLNLELEAWEPGGEERVARSFIEKLEESQAVLLLIGSRGLGPWIYPDVRDALEKRVRAQRRALSVLLPDVEAFPESEMPAFLGRNTWIKLVRGVEDQRTLERIIMGLSGTKPESRVPGRPRPPGGTPDISLEQDPIEEALERLLPLLDSRNLTVLLGKRAVQNGPAFPPGPCELARTLLVSLELIEPSYDHLLPPLDVVGSYYAAGPGETNLEIEVNQIIGRRSKETPPILGHMAKLLYLLEKRSRNHSRLIVTTGFDLLLERALLGMGVAFTRVVQHWSSHRIDVNEYQKVERTERGELRLSHQNYEALVPADDVEALDRQITAFARRQFEVSKGDSGYDLPLNEFKGTILYKFHGSQDTENSCAITADQHLHLSRKLIPNRITAHAASGPVLVLGHGPLDSDFRLVCNMLLPDSRDSRRDCRYALLLSPELEREADDRRIEAKLWRSIKKWVLSQFGIEIVESSGDHFLEQLNKRLSGAGT